MGSIKLQGTIRIIGFNTAIDLCGENADRTGHAIRIRSNASTCIAMI